MKIIIGLLALLSVAAYTVDGEENSTVSNGTISSKVKSDSPDILKRIAAFFDKVGKGKSTTKEANTTVSSVELSRSNVTRDNSTNATLSPTTGNHEANLNITAHENDSNVTIREGDLNITENNLALNYTEEITKDSTIKESDASLIANGTQYLENNTIPDNAKTTVDGTNLNDEDKDPYTLRGDESTLRSTVEAIASECNTKNGRDTSIVPESPTSIVPESPTSIVPESPTSIVPESPTSIVPESPTSIVPESPTSIVPESSTLSPEDFCKPYIDKLLIATFSEHGDNLDPLILGDRKMSIETKFLIGSTKSELGLYDGRVTGISKAKIIGECSVQTGANRMILKSTLSFDEIGVSYTGIATILNLGPKIAVNGRLDGALVELVIAVPKGGGAGEIEDVRVKNIGKLKVSVKGLGPLNRGLGLISEEIANVFRLEFKRVVERELRDAMQKEIEKIKYP